MATEFKYPLSLLESNRRKFCVYINTNYQRPAILPCSIALYEKSDGKVYVSSMNMGLMAKMFNGVVGDALSKVASDDARILSFLE